jgi:isopentenyl-diphosphate delta-isomerase
MDELIAVVDQEGNLTGASIMKFEAHRLGVWHSCIHVWLYTDDGEVLIQKRVADKDTFPDKWDVSVAGHIGAGESALDAAQRELSEELGVEIALKQLQEIGSYASDIQHSEILIDREFHYIYIAKLHKKVDEIVLQSEEVSEVKLISISDFKQELSAKNKLDKFVPYSSAYYKMVFETIEEQLFM